MCACVCPPYTVHKLLLYQQSGGPDEKNNCASRKDKKKNNGQVFHLLVWESQKMRPVSAFTPRSQRDGGNLCIRSVKLSKNNDKHLCACVCVFAFSSFVVVPQLVPCPFLPLFSSNCQIFLQTKDVLKNREREIV